MYGVGTLAPVPRAYSALIEKTARGALAEAEAGQTTPVQQVGVLNRSDQREASLHPGRFFVAACDHSATLQSRQTYIIDTGKTLSSFHPGAACSIA
jgi:hypothetical protein